MSEVATVTSITHLAAALDYVKRGWFVFPVHSMRANGCSCMSKCGRPGKHPRISNGFHGASDDPDTIKDWWSKWPDANIGLAMGKSKLVALDIDPRNQGDENFREMELEHGSIPSTLTNLTGGGGFHYIFLLPDGCSKPKSRVPKPGVEIKGDGSYILLPPSNHISGKQYIWDSGQEEAPVPAPFWVVDPPPTRHYDKSSRPPIEGIMGAAFVAAGMAGELISHDRMTVQCPFESEHSQGAKFDTSTIVYGPTGKTNRGWFHCSHSHCLGSGRTQDDILRALPPDALEVARDKVPKADKVLQVLLQEEWEKSLRRNAQGIVTKDAGNLALMLQNAEEWKGAIGYDESLDTILWLKSPPRVIGMPAPGTKGEGLTDDAYIYTQHWFVMNRGVSFTKEVVQDVLVSVARQNTFNSLTQDFDSVPWDGVDRISNWLHTYCGAEDNEYTRMIGRMWLIGAIARAHMPGCQMDTVLVLEGKQGAGKSTAFRILGGKWYTAGLPRLDDKDAKAHAHQAWLHEIEELNAIYGVEASAIKGYITALKDYYRPPYGRHYVTRSRRCVFSASTNEGEYLHDPTGARRFWPVKISLTKRVDLERDRSQLLAEALNAFHKGEQWYPEQRQEAVLEVEQQGRQTADPWDSRIVGSFKGCTIGEMLGQIGVPPERQTPAQGRRLAGRLRALGWDRRQPPASDSRGRVWVWYPVEGKANLTQLELPAERKNPYTD